MHVRILKNIFILVGLAFPALIVFSPILFGGQVFADADTLLQTYPAAQFLRTSLLRADSFLWTPEILTGFPLANSFLGGFFSPVYQFLFSHFDAFSTYHFLTAINFILTAWLTFALCRKLRLSIHAAFFAGITISLSTAYWLFSANLTVTSGYWSFPGLLLAALILYQCRSSIAYVFTVLVSGGLLGLVFLHSHPQWPLQALAVVFIFASLASWREPQLSTTFRWKAPIGIILISVIGLLIALPQLLPTWQQGLLSARAGGVSMQEAMVGALIPGDFTSFIFPDLSIHRIINKPGFLYIGAFGLLLAIISLGSKKDFFYKFFLGTFITMTAIAIKHSPLFWIVHRLPVFESFREPSRFMYIGLFALVIMAAYGLDFIIRSGQTVRVQKLVTIIWRFVLAGIGLLIFWHIAIRIWGDSILSRIINYFDTNLYTQTTGLPLEHYHNVIVQLFNQIVDGTTLSGTAFTIGMSSLLVATALLAAWSRGTITHRTFITLFIVFATANMVGITMARSAFIPKTEIVTVPPHITALKNNAAEPFRVWSFFPGTSMFQKLDSVYGHYPIENVRLHKALLTPNTGILYAQDSFDYYDDIMDRRHARLLGYLGSDRSTFGESLAQSDISFTEKKQLFLDRLNLLSAYNVKYIFSLFPLEHTQLKRVLEVSVTTFDIPLYVYENQEVLPRYYLTDNVRLLPTLNEEESWNQLLEHQSNILDETLIECDACADRNTTSSTTGLTPLLPSWSDNDEYEFVLSLTTARWFVIGHNNLPGWRATIDNSETPIYRANFINQALYIPEGEHVVRLEYK